MENKPNKLINELSPYLIQHAYNPVDWHAWNDEAFAEAKRQNKPVFLSIGYSACHWCHVMEKESFDDPEIANMMNQTFINIKVDREERPDIDHIYMTVCQVMTGSGGWPLTVLMTPDKKPFFAGTYFPKETIGNRVGIKDVIKRTQQVWSNNYRELLESADEITAQINFFREPGNLSTINKNLINKAFYEVAGTFDEQYGGFSKRPKFPIPHNLTFLLRYSHIFGNSEAAKMALFTLQKMRFGGIYDHIGKGFHRYSTDREWLVPHFEKMLYDQALLAISFTEAYLHTKDKFYKKTALDILDYVKRELASPEGGFYSAEDADSEGEEGKFYLWNFKEIRSSLIGNVEFFCDIFNIQEKGNYHDEFTGELNGKNIPHLKTELSEYGEKYNLSQNELENKVSELINKLFEIRETRKYPHKDDKILTDWNGMMIAAFAYSGRAFGNMELIEVAKSAANFIINQMSDKNGRLFHRYRNGSAGILGMLDDYAAFIWGLIELFKSTSDFYYIEQSERLMKIVMEDFYDNKSGGFFFTSIQAEQLIIRKKELYDGASPSGNSMMLSNLINLWKITAYNEYNETIQSHIKCFELSVSSVPSAYTFFMAGLIDYINGGSEIVITGNDINLINESFDKFNNEYLPGSMIVKLTDNRIPEWLNDYKSVQEPLKIFVCRNYQCESPFYNLDDALKFVLTLSN